MKPFKHESEYNESIDSIKPVNSIKLMIHKTNEVYYIETMLFIYLTESADRTHNNSSSTAFV